MTVDLRIAGPDDAARLAALAARTFPLACPPSTTPEAIAEYLATELDAASFARHLADADTTILLAEQGGEAVAYTMLVAGEPDDADVVGAVAERPAVQLSKVYAGAETHGTGLTAELMRASLELARESGAVVVWLGVSQENARAIRFYEKHGFRTAGTKRFRLGGRLEDDWIMARPLG